MSFKEIFIKTFAYTPSPKYNFDLEDSNINNNNSEEELLNSKIFPSLDVNLDIIKEIYLLNKNGDINIREFTLPIKSKNFKAFLIYIDGIINQDSVNDFILQPLLLRNSINMNPTQNNSTAITQNISIKKVKKFD